jgi:arsenite methyltransferase
MSTHTESQVKKAVRDRYARAATEGGGCCEPSCCGGSGSDSSTTADPSAPSEGQAHAVSKAVGYSDEELAEVPGEANLGLGCGNPTALAGLRAGETVLDLGSGAGIDCFLASKRVGPGGKVIGVDMTAEMLAKARASAESGGYENVEFRLGEIEALPVADAAVDVVISNCVLNLSTDRARVLAEAFRVLKPGGRILISDMVSDVPVPDVVAQDLDAVAGCLPTFRDAYIEEYRQAGFEDVRIVEETPYPSEHLLSDAGVKKHLAEHPEHAAELRRFAASIAGAHFEARKPN